MHPQTRATLPLPLLPFLDSADEAVRAVAVDFFRENTLGTEIELDRCVPYLGHRRAEDERIPLLAICLAQLSSSYCDSYSSHDAREKVRALARGALSAEVCPPSFDLLAAALTRCHRCFRTSRGKFGFQARDLVSKQAAPVVAARVLASLGQVGKLFHARLGVAEPEARGEALEMVLSLDERSVGQVLCDWYRVEAQPSAREVVVDPKVSWPKTPEWLARRRALLEIASKDWEKTIAAKAKALLAQ